MKTDPTALFSSYVRNKNTVFLEEPSNTFLSSPSVKPFCLLLCRQQPAAVPERRSVSRFQLLPRKKLRVNKKRQAEFCVTPCFDVFQLSSASGVADVKKSAWEKVAALIRQFLRSGVFFLLLQSRNFCCRICQSSSVLVSTDGRFQDTSTRCCELRAKPKIQKCWFFYVGDGVGRP